MRNFFSITTSVVLTFRGSVSVWALELLTKSCCSRPSVISIKLTISGTLGLLLPKPNRKSNIYWFWHDPSSWAAVRGNMGQTRWIFLIISCGDKLRQRLLAAAHLPYSVEITSRQGGGSSAVQAR